MPILISACLAGINCYYKGGNKLLRPLKEKVDRTEAIAVCPEELGGLPTPRQRSEIKSGTGKDVLSGKANVLTKKGKDVTGAFIAGAEKTLMLAREHGVKLAVMKARSPSCGCGEICDGSFSKTLRKGNGVTSELLCQNGIKVITEEAFLRGAYEK